MTREDKQLLLVDLCARLPYDPIVYIDENLPRLKLGAATRVWEYIAVDKPCKPYLRPMSSMTEEEEEEFNKIKESVEAKFINAINSNGFTLAYYELIDWLNKHHFDYRGLIFRGLALEAKEGMYNDSFT